MPQNEEFKYLQLPSGTHVQVPMTMRESDYDSYIQSLNLPDSEFEPAVQIQGTALPPVPAAPPNHGLLEGGAFDPERKGYLQGGESPYSRLSEGVNLYRETARTPLSSFEEDLVDSGHDKAAIAAATTRQTLAQLASPLNIAITAVAPQVMAIKYAGPVLRTLLTGGAILEGALGTIDMLGKNPDVPAGVEKIGAGVLATILPGVFALQQHMMERPGFTQKVATSLLGANPTGSTENLIDSTRRAAPYLMKAEKDLEQGGQTINDYMSRTGGTINLPKGYKVKFLDPHDASNKLVGDARDADVYAKLQGMARMQANDIYENQIAAQLPDDVQAPRLFNETLNVIADKLAEYKLTPQRPGAARAASLFNQIIGGAPGHDPNNPNPAISVFLQPDRLKTPRDLLTMHEELNARLHNYILKNNYDKNTAAKADVAVGLMTDLKAYLKERIVNEYGVDRRLFTDYGALKDVEVASGEMRSIYEAAQLQNSGVPYAIQSGLAVAAAGGAQMAKGSAAGSTVAYGLSKALIGLRAEMMKNQPRSIVEAFKDARGPWARTGNPDAFESPVFTKAQLLNRIKQMGVTSQQIGAGRIAVLTTDQLLEKYGQR